MGTKARNLTAGSAERGGAEQREVKGVAEWGSGPNQKENPYLGH